MSSVPLQQTLRHLQGAFTSFFEGRAKYPRFNSRKKSRRSAECTSSAFRYRDGALTPAKMREPLDIVWSRPLPEGAQPSTVTVSLSTGEKIANPRYERRDGPDWPALSGSCLARRRARRTGTRPASGSPGSTWTDMPSMLEYECAWYGRDLIVVDRWFPSSKLCGACGTIRAKLPLKRPRVDVRLRRRTPQRESSPTGRSSVKRETQRATAGIPVLRRGRKSRGRNV